MIFHAATTVFKRAHARAHAMRLLALLVVLALAGCIRGPDASSDGACERVYGPLFDPAGPLAPVEHDRVDLGALDAPAGCRVIEDEDGIREALGAQGREVDPASQRLVTLRASHTVACFTLGQVYRLPSGAVVIETFTREAAEGDACATVWGVGIPRDGSDILHAHDET